MNFGDEGKAASGTPQPLDQERLRLDLLLLCEEIGDSLSVAYYAERFGEGLRSAKDPAVAAEYATIMGRVEEDVKVARSVGRNPNMRWDHPYVRALLADGLIDPED